MKRVFFISLLSLLIVTIQADDSKRLSDMNQAINKECKYQVNNIGESDGEALAYMHGFSLGAYTSLKLTGYEPKSYPKTKLISVNACKLAFLDKTNQTFLQKYNLGVFKTLGMYPE